MAWTKLPLPKMIYKTGDEEQLPSQIGARLVNAYIDNFGHIKKRPGLTEIADLGSGKVNGLYWWDTKGVLIAVMGGNIFKVTTPQGTFSDITGDSLNTSQIVSFADGNGESSVRTLAMANNDNIVIYKNTGVTANIADAQAPTTVSHVTYIDGYLLAADRSVEGKINFSTTGNMEEWVALDFFTSEIKKSLTQFLDARWDEITIFGKEGVNFYYDDGATPFVKLAGAYVDRGIIARNSVQMLDTGWIFMDDKRRIVDLTGRQIRDLSTPFDNEIRGFTNVSSAESMIVEFGSNKFYILTFPAENKTFVIDRSTNGWAEWGDWDDDTKFDRFTGTVSAYCKDWDITVVGDKDNGKIYKIDNNNFQDNGSNIRTLIRTGHIDYGTGNLKKSKRMRMKIKHGTGTISSDDEFSIRWRSDNQAWSNWHSRSLGFIGDRDFYINFGSMGIFRSRQYEIQHTANSDFVLIDWEEDIEDLGR